MSKKEEINTSDILSQILSEISPEQQRKTDKRMLLAAKIKDGMNEKGWRNKDLAEVLNQHQSVTTKWLSGTHNFELNTLLDLEEVLGISILKIEKSKVSQVNHYHLSITMNLPDRNKTERYPGNLNENVPVLFSQEFQSEIY